MLRLWANALPLLALLALVPAQSSAQDLMPGTRSYEGVDSESIPAPQNTTRPADAETEAATAQEGNISPEVQAIINTPDAPVVDEGGITPPTEPPAPPLEAAEPKKPEFEDMPQVELRILDKVRGESRTYVLNVGRTVAYANIRIRPRACRKSSPLDDPENASFLQIWEVKPDGISAWIFSGWMFASSPSLSAMDHPVYDVTVLDCKNPATAAQSSSAVTTGEEAPAGAGPAETEAETGAETEDAGEDTTVAPTSRETAPAEAAPAETTPGASTNETPDSDNAASSRE